MQISVNNFSHPLILDLTTKSSIYQNYLGNKTDKTPVWLMRQAGRSLPEYRKLRIGNTMLEACDNPDLSSEITMQPVDRYKTDAAIFFSDIVYPFYKLGLDVKIVPNKGPVFNHKVETKEDVHFLTSSVDADYKNLNNSYQQITNRLNDIPLIGFAGAPFTVASYIVEGGPTKNAIKTKAFMYTRPDLWSDLLNWVAKVTARFLFEQIQAGASAIQIFDSWAGYLSRDDYKKYALPFTKKILDEIQNLSNGILNGRKVEIPLIHFGLLGPELLEEVSTLPFSCLGIDYKTDLSTSITKFGADFSIQGNLDSTFLLTNWDLLQNHAKKVVETSKNPNLKRGYIFNLGHGVPKESDPNLIQKLVDYVKSS